MPRIKTGRYLDEGAQVQWHKGIMQKKNNTDKPKSQLKINQ